MPLQSGSGKVGALNETLHVVEGVSFHVEERKEAGLGPIKVCSVAFEAWWGQQRKILGLKVQTVFGYKLSFLFSVKDLRDFSWWFQSKDYSYL